MPVAALGIDLASRSWRDNGSALLVFEDARFVDARVPAIVWPDAKLTPPLLADAIDAFARAEGVAAVSIDGPQGWRDPTAPAEQGAGRACERAARTAAKTGVPGTCFPATYRAWVSFSVATFDALTRREHVTLVDAPAAPMSPPSSGSYYLLECFPTSTWRTAGSSRFPPRAGGRRSSSSSRGSSARTTCLGASLPRHTTTSRRRSQHSRPSRCSAVRRRPFPAAARRRASTEFASRA